MKRNRIITAAASVVLAFALLTAGCGAAEKPQEPLPPASSASLVVDSAPSSVTAADSGLPALPQNTITDPAAFLREQYNDAETVRYAGWFSQEAGWLVLGGDVGMGRQKNYVFLTQDGGATWTETGNTNGEYEVTLSGAGFLNEQVGFLCFRYRSVVNPVIYRTGDGGAGWSRIELAVPDIERYRYAEPQSPEFADGLVRLPVTLYGEEDENTLVVFVSADEGLTWTAAAQPEPAQGTAEYQAVYEKYLEPFAGMNPFRYADYDGDFHIGFDYNPGMAVEMLFDDCWYLAQKLDGAQQTGLMDRRYALGDAEGNLPQALVEETIQRFFPISSEKLRETAVLGIHGIPGNGNGSIRYDAEEAAYCFPGGFGGGPAPYGVVTEKRELSADTMELDCDWYGDEDNEYLFSHTTTIQVQDGAHWQYIANRVFNKNEK